MKKKLLLCALILALALSLCACGASTMAEAEPITDTCTVNGYTVQIVGAHLLYGANGDAQVAVELNYTNSNADATSFMNVGQVRVFQNGVEQQSDEMVLGEGFAWDSYYTQIKGGASIPVFIAKPISSETDPIEVNVEIINQNNGKIIAKAAATLEMTPASVIDYEMTFASCKAAPSNIAGMGDYVQVIVAVENTGTEAISFNYGYFDIKNENGVIIDSPSMPNTIPYVAPGETAYFSLSNTTMNAQYIAASSLTVEPYFEVDKAYFTPGAVEISDVNLNYEADSVYNNYGSSWVQPGRGFVATGNVTNVASERISMSNISVVLFNGNTPIGILSGWTDGISPGATVAFEASDFCTNNFVTQDQVTDCKVFVYPFP